MRELRINGSPYPIAFLTVGVVLALIGVAVWQPPSELAQLSLELSIGLFASIISALAFVFALTIRTGQEWPPIFELFRRTGIPEWLFAAVLAILLAIFGEASSGRASSTAFSGAIILSLTGLLAGLFSLRSALVSAGGRGRTAMLAHILRDSFSTTGHPGSRETFTSNIRKALESADVETVRDRVDELLAARQALSQNPEAVADVLAFQLQVLSETGRRIATGALPPSGVEVLTPLVEDIVSGSGFLNGDQGRNGDYCQHQPAVLICEATRVCGRLWRLAYSHAQQENHNSFALKEIMDAMSTARSHLRIAADPDPPATEIEPQDPWPRGLDDPVEGLAWAWAWIEHGSPRSGEALYVLSEILTGKKFYGSYGEGDSPIDFIEEEFPHRPGASELLSRIGGLRRASLELAVAQISGSLGQGWMPPSGVSDLAATLTPNSHLAMRLRLFAFPKDPTRLGLEDALAEFAHLVGSGQAGGRLWKVVVDFLRGNGGRSRGIPIVPLILPFQRPVESVICVALRMLPMEEGSGSTRATERFLAQLPANLIHNAALETRRSIGVAGERPEAPAKELLENLTVVWSY